MSYYFHVENITRCRLCNDCSILFLLSWPSASQKEIVIMQAHTPASREKYVSAYPALKSNLPQGLCFFQHYLNRFEL